MLSTELTFAAFHEASVQFALDARIFALSFGTCGKRLEGAREFQRPVAIQGPFFLEASYLSAHSIENGHF